VSVRRTRAIWAGAVWLCASAPPQHELDLTHYFASAAYEVQQRTALERDITAFTALPTPTTVQDAATWLTTFEQLLRAVRGHQAYLKVRSARDPGDLETESAYRAVNQMETPIRDRVTAVVTELGPDRLRQWTTTPALRDYAYFLEQVSAQSGHRVPPGRTSDIDGSVRPILDGASDKYRQLRTLPGSLADHEEEYASLLLSIVRARDQLAKARSFPDAVDAANFDRGLSQASVDRMLRAVAASKVYGDYHRIAAGLPRASALPPFPIDSAIGLVLDAERPVAAGYSDAFNRLLDPASGRLDICTAPSCDDTGFSVGFSGVLSGAYFGGYTGTLANVMSVAHESAHAVHRQLMNDHQPHAVYNSGPNYVFESFAIFSELLFVDHQYRTASSDTERERYLNAFLNEATFEVFGSAGETDLEAAIYHETESGHIRVARDLGDLSRRSLAKYNPAAADQPNTALYWARNRLYFIDPLYDVNYLYAGVLALNYFDALERAPTPFATKYVALVENGFDDSVPSLMKRFLDLDITDEGRLVTTATAFLENRTKALDTLRSKVH
jgi:oligoendopeptidase F